MQSFMNIGQTLRDVATLPLPDDDNDFTPAVARACLVQAQAIMMAGALEIERLTLELEKAL